MAEVRLLRRQGDFGFGGAASGALSGAISGATLGSGLPLIGTGVGALVGAGIGALGGGFMGGSSATMHDPLTLAKRYAVAAGFIPSGREGRDIFVAAIQAGNAQAIQLALQFGVNVAKLRSKAPLAIGSGTRGAVTVAEAPRGGCQCDTRAEAALRQIYLAMGGQ